MPQPIQTASDENIEDPYTKSIGSGRIEHVKKNSKSAVQKLRKSLADVLTPRYTDAVLEKWLTGTNFDLIKSERFIRETIATRIVYQVNDKGYSFRSWEIIDKYKFSNFIGYAKDGTPISYITAGTGDFNGFLCSVCGVNLAIFSCTVFEQDLYRARESGRKLGKEINEITYIMDMKDYDFRTTLQTSFIEAAWDLFTIMQEQAPGVYKKIFIINVSTFVYQLFQILRPIFKEFITRKLHFLSKDETPGTLLRYIDADVLPAFLGGTRVDSNGDPTCSEFIKFGGKIDPSYLFPSFPLDPSEPGVEVVQVPARSCLRYRVVVKRRNTWMHIQLKSEGGSIACSTYFVPTFNEKLEQIEIDGKNEVLRPEGPYLRISPTCRIQAHLCPIDYHAKAVDPGTYVFKFDNSYSWLTSKNLTFRIRLSSTPPYENNNSSEYVKKDNDLG